MRDFAKVEVSSRGAWRDWLEAHAARTESVWLVSYRKGRGPYAPYADLVEEALCFGWIDSLPRRLDERRTMLLMSPRRAGSAWSRLNKQRIERLAASGLMTEAGLAVIEAAKTDGSWTSLDAAGALETPADLAGALARLPNAGARFAAFPPSVRRGILEWIEGAKRPATRARRVAATAAAAAGNERVAQWRST